MDSSTLGISRHGSKSANKIGSSDPDIIDQTLDIESGKIHDKLAPGIWRFPMNPKVCCIYRVPERIRKVNPEAYTPQLVIIGPLHHSTKCEALKFRGDTTNAKLMGYLNTEAQKKIYLADFTRKVGGKHIIEGFRRSIEEEEGMIRASYSESTGWIESSEFVEMILQDSVFIVEFLLRLSTKKFEKTGDRLTDEPCLGSTIMHDLVLLENQLPYFIIEKLFDPIVPRFRPNWTLRELVIYLFLRGTKIRSKFVHFTDIVRCVRVETVLELGPFVYKPMYQMYNADKLHRRRVRFEAIKDELSVKVKFKKGVLKIPEFRVEDSTEIKLRNIMAFEQCHHPFNAHVCSYIIFLDFLIDTEKDVELLVEKEIIRNMLGHDAEVAKMVNKLCLGIVFDGSYYSKIAKEIIDYYDNDCNKSRSTLRNMYCSDLWRGTATVGATVLLLFTLIQTFTSIIQVWPK